VKNGHVQSQNRHGPEWAWMDSVCLHQEQVLAGLASGSIQRTTDWLALVTKRPPSVVRATEVSADWGSPFLGRRTYLPQSFVARLARASKNRCNR
jgi:hypothetical protein